VLPRGGRLRGSDDVADILIRDGAVERIEPRIVAPAAGDPGRVGAVVLPGFVEAHCHLDKTLYGLYSSTVERFGKDRGGRYGLGGGG
jgi:cytosine deaminase